MPSPVTLSTIGQILQSIPQERKANEELQYQRMLDAQNFGLKQRQVGVDEKQADAQMQNQALLRAIQQNQQTQLNNERDVQQGLRIGNERMPGIVDNPESARVMRMAGWDLKDTLPTQTFVGDGTSPSLSETPAPAPVEPKVSVGQMQMRDPYFAGSRETQVALMRAMGGNDPNLEEIAVGRQEQSLGRMMTPQELTDFHEHWMKDSQPRQPFSFVVQTAQGPGMVQSGDPNVKPLMMPDGARAQMPPTADMRNQAVASDDLLQNAKLALELGRRTNWNGVGAFGTGRLKQFGFQQLGMGSQDDEDLRNLLDSLRAESSFARGGKNLTGTEKGMIDQFLMNVNRNPRSADQALENFIAQLARRRGNIAPGIPQNLGGPNIPNPQVTAPGTQPPQTGNMFGLNLPPKK